MKFHYIQQGYFGDREYRLLSRDEGYFFCFLWQLPQLSAGGIGRISLAMMAAESYDKFPIEECQTLLGALQARHRLIYDDEWLWIVNYYKYKPGGSSMALLNAKSSLEECESRLIFDGWNKKYGHLERVKKHMGNLKFLAPERVPQQLAQGLLDGITAEPEELHLHRAEVDAAWAHYQKKMKTEAELTPKRRQRILERLRETIMEDGVPRIVQVEDLFRAITNCTKSDWHMGRDPKTNGHHYNSLEDHILTTQEKFLYWFTYDGRQPAPEGKTSPKGEIVYREESPSPSAKWSGERTSPEDVKAIVRRTVKKLGGPDDGESTERVFR